MSDKKNGNSKQRIKSLLVEPFQHLKLGVYVLAISVTFSVLIAFVFLNAFFEQYRHVLEIFQVVDPNMQWEMMTNDVFYQNAVRLGLVLLVFLIVTWVVVFRATYRYYKPMKSILSLIDGIRQGDYSQRITDEVGSSELRELTEKMNKMAEVLDQRHSESPAGKSKKNRNS